MTVEVAPVAEQSAAAEPAKMRSCVLFGIRFSHMRTKHSGWATDITYEDAATKVLSVAVLSLTQERMNDQLCGFRLVIGRHSIWAMA